MVDLGLYCTCYKHWKWKGGYYSDTDCTDEKMRIIYELSAAAHLFNVNAIFGHRMLAANNDVAVFEVFCCEC